MAQQRKLHRASIKRLLKQSTAVGKAYQIKKDVRLIEMARKERKPC